MPGLAELLLILFVVLIIFGASKLPAIATSMGQAIQKLRNEKSGENAGEEGQDQD